MADQNWSLLPDQRSLVVMRTGSNLYSLGFQAKRDLTEDVANETAQRLEKEAYLAAQVQSTTTTGARPAQETKKIYLRKLAELVVEFVKSGNTVSASEEKDKSTTTGVFDLSGGKRDFLSKEKAETLFKPLFNTEQKIHTVILSTKSFGLDAADVACKALLEAVVATLHTANLSDIIGGRPENEALQVLEKLSKALSAATLHEVDLSNNALGEKGLRACAELFKSQVSLKVLSLHNIGCSPDACVALNELTREIKLGSLFLYNNMSGDEGAKAIGEMLARMPTIEHLQMASSRVGCDGVMDLTAGLKSASGLLSLDLNDNPATAESVPGIVKLLECQKSLQRLNLSDTSLEDEGVANLSAALLNCAPKLEVLELALNDITSEGAKALGRALQTKKALKKLDLHENELEDQGAMIIAKSIAEIGTLEELNMGGNMLCRVGAVSLAKALKGKQQFKKLFIDENQISAKGIEEVKSILVSLFGNAAVLGPLDENDEQSDEENELEQIDLEQSDLDQLIGKIDAISLKD